MESLSPGVGVVLVQTSVLTHNPHTPAQHDVVEVFVAWAPCRVEEFVITANVACTEGNGLSS